jgi:hypothetical protein
MPMQPQSLEFIVGYTFADIQRRFFRLTHENKYLEDAELAINIPKLWFGVPNCTNSKSSATLDDQNYIIKRSCEILSIIFPKWNINSTSEVNHQYQEFKFKFEKKIIRQQMTIKDIEEILGYPIEIVAENN